MGEDQIVVTVDAALADLVPIFLANCRAHARTLRQRADALRDLAGRYAKLGVSRRFLGSVARSREIFLIFELSC